MEKSDIKLTSAKVEVDVEVEAELGNKINCLSQTKASEYSLVLIFPFDTTASTGLTRFDLR